MPSSAARGYSLIPNGEDSDADVDNGDDCIGLGTGSVADVCFEPEGAVTASKWAFSGEGQGSWSKTQAYNFVGDGGGDWEKQLTTTNSGCRVRPCCIVFSMLLILAMGIYIAAMYSTESIWAPPPVASLSPIQNTVIPSAEVYNCNNTDVWSFFHKDWCCRNADMGCPTTTSVHYDCQVGLRNYMVGWAPAKKSWCCEFEHLGCPTQAPPASAAEHTISRTTSRPPRTTVERTAVPKPVPSAVPLPVPKPMPVPAPVPVPTPTPLPYDCSVGLGNLWAVWPAPKHAWCCRNKNLGCPTTPPPMDCSAGFSNWVAGWSMAKKTWCCTHAGRGCPTVAPPKPTPHPAPPQTPRPEPLPKPTTSWPFYCQVGRKHWVKGWSDSKKAWCCHHEHFACHPPPAPSTTTLAYNCNVDYTDCYECLEKRWSVAKRTWCCHNHHRGCQRSSTTSASIPYDCTAGLAEPVKGWSQRKETWCCKHEHRGCHGR